jgi:PPOX class probable F420-dependent enzyme
MELPVGLRDRLAADLVVWLTTITDEGAPAPYPVWFVVDDDDIVVFSEPTSRRVHNIAARPTVSLNFNSDPYGGDVWVLTGRATTTAGVAPSGAHGYIDKYGESIDRDLRTTVEAIDATYDTEIRITPTRIVTV